MSTIISKKENKHINNKFLLVQAVTLSRIPLAFIFFLVLLYVKSFSTVIVIGIIILSLIELSDLFDGKLARRFSVVNEFGALLDPYADSISRIIVYWAMANASLVHYLVPLTMVFRDVTVAYCRIILAQHNHTVSSNWSGKIKAGFQGVGAFVLVLGPLYWPWTGKWTITAGSVILIIVTLGSITEYARTAVSVLINKINTDV